MKIFKIFSTKLSKNNYYESQKFYRTHPDLAPRNVYLYNGRIAKMDDVIKYFEHTARIDSIKDKIESVKKYITGIFKK